MALPSTSYADRTLPSTTVTDRFLPVTTTALKTSDGKYVLTSDGYVVLVDTLGNLYTARSLPTTAYMDR